jgi:hypothetical protein
LLGLVAEELNELDRIGQRQLEIYDVPLDSLRDESHRGADDYKLPLVETGFIEVPQAASDPRILP